MLFSAHRHYLLERTETAAALADAEQRALIAEQRFARATEETASARKNADVARAAFFIFYFYFSFYFFFARKNRACVLTAFAGKAQLDAQQELALSKTHAEESQAELERALADNTACKFGRSHDKSGAHFVCAAATVTAKLRDVEQQLASSKGEARIAKDALQSERANREIELRNAADKGKRETASAAIHRSCSARVVAQSDTRGACLCGKGNARRAGRLALANRRGNGAHSQETSAGAGRPARRAARRTGVGATRASHWCASALVVRQRA